MDYIFKNNFGELYNDKITIQINEKLQTIDFKNIVRIQYVKRQKLHINYLSVLIAIYLIIYLVNNPFSYIIVQVIISILAVLFLAASYFYKSFQYRFVIIDKNYFREVIINKNMSCDAEEFASQINRIFVK